MNIIGCTPIQLEKSHVDEIRKLIQDLPAAAEANSTTNDINLERFEKLVMLYSDEPQLLDPILREVVESLLLLISWPSSFQIPLSTLSLAAISRLRVLTRTRGYKVMIRILPHEVNHLNKILLCLEYYALKASQPYNSKDKDRRIIFMLTVWLLIICKNPFSLSKFDSNSTQARPVVERIVDCLSILLDHYIPQGELTVLSTLLAQILTRNEDNSDVLRPRISKSFNEIKEFNSETDGGRLLITHLRMLISLFKWGKRKEMRPYGLELLKSVPNQVLNVDCMNIEVRNLVTKLLQRVALVLLKPRLASWRYKCGFRSLEESLKGRREMEDDSENCAKADEQDDSEENGEHIPYHEIETILSEVLLKINDRDNLVRWTAAKGVARICSRLPKELAAEVVASILSSSFDPEMVGGTWHGGCLALAELCRRGCLLPDQVPQVVEVLTKALLFEQSHIGFSVSVNVRDAACYISWAFARAYEASVLRVHLRGLAGELVCLALFDREVNIRRAASAAFQENVGRNDSFPEGIRVLTIIDYIDVALIKKCYLELAVQVAEYEDYRVPMLNHLLTYKTQHWDETVRELAADSLQQLVSFDVEYSRNKILPQLCARLNNKDATEEHGTLFGVGGVLMGLWQTNKTVLEDLQQLDVLLETIPKTVALLKDHRVKGFPLLSKAVCRLIQALCVVQTPLSDSQLKNFHDVLDTVVSDKNKKLHSYAANAFPALMCYYQEGHRFELLIHRVFKKYFVGIEETSEDELQKVASITPLSYIPHNFLSEEVSSDTIEKGLLLEVVISRLLKVIYNKSILKWVFARVASIETITSLLMNCAKSDFNWMEVIQSCIYLSDDFTCTINGDIGRFGRKAAVVAIGKLLHPATSSEASLPQLTVNLALGKILQRCCEPIDDLRHTACSTMTNLLEICVLPIQERELLVEVFCSSTCTTPKEDGENFSEVDWKHSKGFMKLAQLLDSKLYKQHALEGFILSAGSVSEWMSQSALLAIVQHLRPIKKNIQQMENFLQDVLTIFHRLKQRSDPCCVLQLLRMLLIERVFSVYEKSPDDWPIFLQLNQEILKLAVSKGKPKIKLLAVQVVGCLLQVNPNSQLYHKCMSLIISMLESPYSALREVAVEQLFEALNGLLDESTYCLTDLESAIKLLRETPWTSTNEDEKLRIARELLSNLLLPNK